MTLLKVLIKHQHRLNLYCTRSLLLLPNLKHLPWRKRSSNDSRNKKGSWEELQQSCRHFKLKNLDKLLCSVENKSYQLSSVLDKVKPQIPTNKRISKWWINFVILSYVTYIPTNKYISQLNNLKKIPSTKKVRCSEKVKIRFRWDLEYQQSSKDWSCIFAGNAKDEVRQTALVEECVYNLQRKCWKWKVSLL